MVSLCKCTVCMLARWLELGTMKVYKNTNFKTCISNCLKVWLTPQTFEYGVFTGINPAIIPKLTKLKLILMRYKITATKNKI